MRRQACLAAVIIAWLSPAGAMAEAVPCVEVEIGSDRPPPDRSLECLSAWLVRDVPPRRFGAGSSLPVLPNVAPAAAGTFSAAATANQLGDNFGRSARPQRPAAPDYASPVAPRR